MELEATNPKKKRKPSQPKPDGLNQRQKMEKEAPNEKKQKKNPSQPKPDEIKPKAINWKKKQQIKKKKKIHHTLNPTNLNQRQ